MLLEIARITGEELASDICKCSGGCEVARVADGVALVPGIDRTCNDVEQQSYPTMTERSVELRRPGLEGRKATSLDLR